MKLIEAVNANLAAQEMSQQRLPYDLALAVVSRRTRRTSFCARSALWWRNTRIRTRTATSA